jgi:isoaspartyl peptidase/L-asparaginase-like protein (Ntn-hydrolase superfamily)
MAGSALVPSLAAGFPAPAVLRSRVSKFAAVSSANGIRGVARAVELMKTGVDTLDAAVEGVKIQELDPKDNSVGYGGLPNEDGVVQLDASCMHGPTKLAGAVGALEGIKTPSEVARLVMKYTDTSSSSAKVRSASPSPMASRRKTSSPQSRGRFGCGGAQIEGRMTTMWTCRGGKTLGHEPPGPST